MKDRIYCLKVLIDEHLDNSLINFDFYQAELVKRKLLGYKSLYLVRIPYKESSYHSSFTVSKNYLDSQYYSCKKTDALMNLLQGDGIDRFIGYNIFKNKVMKKQKNE